METRVHALMSFGVQTVSPEMRLGEVVSRLRRIGHEGFPVVESGQVIGLLNRRDIDRAVEHGLGDLQVRDVMNVGKVTLQPEDTVNTLLQRMIESGWWQIPVVDGQGNLIGVVTRTDLIKHWAKISTLQTNPVPEVNTEQLGNVLGSRAAQLIKLVGEHARIQNLNVYLVGGVVRDMLLGRANLDIDFVVEGDAIAFANTLQAAYGGNVTSFRPFFTAKWRLENLKILFDELDGDLPDHLDFASARNEFYEQPTALPSVYSSSIKLDLGRRDFTINTIAVQISPTMGQLLDFFGGIEDLKMHLLRVLHNLSFVDDPTRILRAARFEHRLGFKIEQRTAGLINTALPMLRRITGERIRNELTLLLREENPAVSFLQLQERGILRAIHADFILKEEVVDHFQKLEQPMPAVFGSEFEHDDVLWLLVMVSLAVPEKVIDVCERLMFGKTFISTTVTMITVLKQESLLANPLAKPSQVVQRLEDATLTTLYVVWLLSNELVRERIERYLVEWRHVRPSIDGNDLRSLGLTPGPCFRLILERLHTAWLDEVILSKEQERAMLDSMIASKICDE